MVAGKGEEALVHARVELLARQLQAVGAVAVRGAGEPRLRRAARDHKDGAVGHRALAGEGVRALYEVRVQAASVHLVGHGGVGEAVAQHHGAALEGRPDDLGHDLGAGGLVYEQLGLVGQVLVLRIQHHGAQLLAHGGAAGLAQAHHLAAALAQLL